MNNKKTRKALSVPVIDIIIVVIIIVGIVAGVIGAGERNVQTTDGTYRLDLMLYNSDGEKVRPDNGTVLYFDDGSQLGTTKKFDTTAYASGSEKYNASVFVSATVRPDALYCGDEALPIGTEISLHSKTTGYTAVVIAWSRIEEDG